MVISWVNMKTQSCFKLLSCQRNFNVNVCKLYEKYKYYHIEKIRNKTSVHLKHQVTGNKTKTGQANAGFSF